MNWLLLLTPAAMALYAGHAHPILVFLVAALAVIPLGHWMGDATENLARSLGPAIGGLLNATMGTIPDIIIGIFALRHGLVEVVKASITGAIVGNLLLGVGLAMFLGGRRHPRGLHFDLQGSHLLGSLMLLATSGLIIPAIFDFSTASEREISLEVSVVLLMTYLSSMLFTVCNPNTGHEFPAPPRVDSETAPGAGQPRSGHSLLMLAGATVLLAIVSEILTDAVEPAAATLGFTPIFTGIFLLAPVGGAAEILNAVRFARGNQLDLSLAATLGSSTQTALLAAPILVFTGLAIGQPMNLLFSEFQVVAVILAVAAVNNSLTIGSVRWISGIKLIAIYIMLGIGFYYAP